MASSNTFLQVYDALWKMLETKAICELVKLRNRIKLDTRAPYKSKLQTGDLPELRLLPTGATPHLNRTSNGTSYMMTLQIEVELGCLEVAALYEISYELLRAFSDWQTKVKIEVNGAGINFPVVHCKPTTVSEVILESDQSRGVKEWTAIWACEVLLFFRTADLQAT